MTPFFQRVKDQKPDCLFVFIPSGSHASAVVKTYGQLGLRQAGIKLIGPKDVVPDSKLQTMGDAAIGTIVMSSYSNDLDNPANKAFVKAWHGPRRRNAETALPWLPRQALFTERFHGQRT